MLRSRYATYTLILLAVAFLLLRFVHLTADYPRNIRWDDGIVTDEGWYASGAVNQHTWGHPLLNGDMNIPVIMPLWSLIAEAAFRLGGFSVVTLRATAICFFLLCVGLSCLLLRQYRANRWIPLFLLMIAANPWAFAFSRAAFLEFPMLSFVLLAAVLLSTGNSSENLSRYVKICVAGLCFALALLLKTTAVALTPILLYVTYENAQFKLRPALRYVVLFLISAGIAYGAYWFAVVRPRMADVRFYLSVVQNTLRFSLYGFVADTSRPFRYGLGSEHLLFSLSLVAILVSVLMPRLRELWKDRLFAFAAVWLVSFLGFMVKHNNDPARYFAITIPASLFVAVALLRRTESDAPKTHRLLLAAITLDVLINAVQIVTYMAHPTYSFHNATTEIAEIVLREQPHDAVVIGDQMHEVALHNGLRPVNLLFHSDTITEQMKQYSPGWWLQFVPVDDAKCFHQVLSIGYEAQYRKEWQIFYPGQKLVLWKLVPKASTELPISLTASQTAACSPPVYN